MPNNPAFALRSHKRGWTVFDTRSGFAATHEGATLAGLKRAEAENALAHLNREALAQDARGAKTR